jgi:SpoVK/Ycf46/Vps4 family AAA+-type ATPase
MWIGETEKNLGEIFEQASLSEAILLFDEADSLFARRTEVKNSTDRYANQSVNFLLQKLEEFDGISILTTNRKDSIDEAFRRRLRFQIEFPMPDETHRTWLWQSMIPPECEITGPIRWERLASMYRMGGGNIQNAVLRAAFLAAAAGTGLSEEVLVAAANDEYLGLGKLVPSSANETNGTGASDDAR